MAQVRWASAVYCLRKIYKSLFTPNCTSNMLLLVNNSHEKSITESQGTRNLTAHARYLLQHAPVLKLYTFSSNQEYAIFHR